MTYVIAVDGAEQRVNGRRALFVVLDQMSQAERRATVVTIRGMGVSLRGDWVHGSLEVMFVSEGIGNA